MINQNEINNNQEYCSACNQPLTEEAKKHYKEHIKNTSARAVQAFKQSDEYKNMEEKASVSKEDIIASYKQSDEYKNMEEKASVSEQDIISKYKESVDYKMEKKNFVKSLESELKSANKRVEELEARMDTDNERKGEILEDTLEDFLHEWFDETGDLITDVSKGKKGGDVIHEVLHNSIAIGKIKIEAKNTKTWSNKWLNDLRDNMIRYKADFGLLITKALPKDFSAPCMPVMNDKIFIIHYKSLEAIKSLITGIRLAFEEAHKQKTKNSLTESEHRQVLDWLFSNNLKTDVLKHIATLDVMSKNLNKERDAAEAKFDERSKNIRDLRQTLRSMFTPLHTIESTAHVNLLDIND